MLLTDRRIVTAKNLIAYDQEAQDVADSLDPAINIPKFCEYATVQICSYLLGRLQSAASLTGSSALSSYHTAAVFNRGGNRGMTSRARLEQIVIDNPYSPVIDSPLVLWATHFALFLLYREVSNRKILDRYADKAKRYEEDANTRFIWLKQTGLPVVGIPFPCPAAELWPNPGKFDSEDISQVTVPPGTAAGGDYQFAVAWVDIHNYNPLAINRGNAESAPSRSVQTYVEPNSRASASIANLNPPDGMPLAGSHLAAALPSVRATHWQLLAGPTGGHLRVQNAVPIPLATTSYLANLDPAAQSGLPASAGQASYDNLLMYEGLLRW